MSSKAASHNGRLRHILLADDHGIVREGLKLLLLPYFSGTIFGEAGTAREVWDHLGRRSWDLLLLDINLPDKSGLDLLKELRIQYPRLPALMLTMHPEKEFGVRCLQAGAAGYLTKVAPADEVVRAVSRVLEGGKYLSPTLAEELAGMLENHRKVPLHQNLSDRELEVMLLLAQGRTVSEIASQLSLSVKTIATHHQHILRKMRLRNNAQLMHYAFQHRLVE